MTVLRNFKRHVALQCGSQSRAKKAHVEVGQGAKPWRLQLHRLLSVEWDHA